MDSKKMKKGLCTLKLENLQKVYNEKGEEDESLLRATFSILDFKVSGNKFLVPKDVCLRSAHTLKYKPLLCQYKETTDYENPNDDFGTHGEYEGKLRNGEDYIFTDSHAIGVSEKEGYLGVIKNEDGEDEDVLLADFVLWVYRYPNEISLISDFHESEEPLYTSCEFYYTSSEEVEEEDGTKYEKATGDIIFDGHCCLGQSVSPAYDSSKLISFNTKWTKAMNQLNIKNKQNNKKSKEDNNMPKKEMFKKICELSHDDIRSQIYQALRNIMTEDEYYDSYITECYDNYFIISDWSGESHKYLKAGYTKTDTTVTVDWDNKVEVMLYQEWREIPEAQSVLNELNSKIDTLEKEKNEAQTKLNEATETITSLNTKVEELKPIAEQHNKEQYEKELNTKKSFYEEKFKAVNALDKFKEDEVQELIKKTVNEDEKAVMSLNSMIIDLVKPVETKKAQENEPIKEMSSKRENLIPTNSFENRYFE